MLKCAHPQIVLVVLLSTKHFFSHHHFNEFGEFHARIRYMKTMTPSVYLQGTAAEETTDKRSTISASSATTSTKKEALTETKVKHEKQNCAKEIP